VQPLLSPGARPDDGFDFPVGNAVTFRYTNPGLTTMSTFGPGDYAIFYYTGVEYVKVGGTVDPRDKTVSAATRVGGKYIVKRSLRAESFTLLQTIPSKIFTPNGDGVNDIFQILYDNPSDSPITSAKIFDITGAEVADLKPGPTGTSYVWDGRDR